MKRSKVALSVTALTLAITMPLGDAAGALPAIADPTGFTGPPPEDPKGDGALYVYLGNHRQSPVSREDALSRMVEQAPKGESLYDLHKDRKYVTVTDSSEYDEQQGVFTSTADTVGYEECEDHTSDGEFWFKNRFNLCMTQKVAAVHLDPDTHVPVGTSWFEATVIATAVPGQQHLRFGIRMRHEKDTGATGTPGLIGITLDCANADTSRTSSCTSEADEPGLAIGYPIASWKTSLSGLPFGFTVQTTTTAVPGTDKYAAELRGYFSYLFRVTATSSGLPPNSVNLKNEFWRCDSAAYVFNTNGQCVFHHVISSLQMSASSPTFGLSASFIRDAQNGGPNIAPAISGKKVPGRFQESELHRLYKAYDTGKKIPASRRKIKRTCRDYFGSNYTRGPGGIKVECDEYPFATTYENSAQVDEQSVWDYAVRPVPRTDNGAAGRFYGEWMGRDRILDLDPFYVIITP